MQFYSLTMKKQSRIKISFFIFSICLLFILIINICIGSVSISFIQTKNIILHYINNTVAGSIIWKIRLPRVLGAILCGGYLAVAGLILQVFFRNPIVGPFILGISSGASLFVGIVMLGGISLGLSGIHPFFLSIAAFCGALIVMTIIVVISGRIQHIITLLIIGLMMGYLCHSVTSMLIAFAEKESVKGFVLWEMGSFSGFTWIEFYILLFIGIPILIGTYLMSKPLNALLLGENYAKTMGVNITTFRCLMVALSSGLAAIVTSFAGPIAFIGLAVPHLARLILGTSNNKILVPASFLLGAIITVLCDLIARTIFSPIELPLSAVTSIFGAPIVIILLLKRRNSK